MKIKLFTIITLIGFVSVCCKKKNTNTAETAINNEPAKLEIVVSYEKQDGKGSNQYAVWIEDTEGNLVRTLYVTEFTATGGHAFRETSLPVWVSKANPADLSEEQIDAFSGSTPSSGEHAYIWDLTDQDGNLVGSGNYIYVVEGTYLGNNQVIFMDNFTIGNTEIISNPRAQYSSEEMTNRDMIKSVKATFIPKK